MSHSRPRSLTVPDLWFWLLLGVVNAGLVVTVWMEAVKHTERRWSDAVSRREGTEAADKEEAFKAGRAYEKERNLNIAAADEAARLAMIRKNRSDAQKERWARRKLAGDVVPSDIPEVTP
jgi:hypothetical protein